MKFASALLAAAVAATVAGTGVAAETYPSRPVRIICVTAPGGGLDVIGRLVADRLARNWGQPVIVDNRPGAGGNIASEYAAKANPDGYTLLETTTNHNINPFLFRKPGYDPRRDFVPVVQLSEAPSLIIVGPQSTLKSLKDVIAAARGGKLAYASGGNGQPTHIAMEMFKRAANLDVTHIPYKGGGPANQDVMAGQVPMAMAALPGVSGYIQSGLLRAIAVTSLKRWPTLPDVPSIAESGYPGYEHLTWIGLLAPSGTPAALVGRLNREVSAVLALPEVRQRIVAIGAEPVGRSAADFTAMLKADFEATGKLVKQIGLKAD